MLHKHTNHSLTCGEMKGFPCNGDVVGETHMSRALALTVSLSQCIRFNIKIIIIRMVLRQEKNVFTSEYIAQKTHWLARRLCFKHLANIRTTTHKYVPTRRRLSNEHVHICRMHTSSFVCSVLCIQTSQCALKHTHTAVLSLYNINSTCWYTYIIFHAAKYTQTSQPYTQTHTSTYEEWWDHLCSSYVLYICRM